MDSAANYFVQGQLARCFQRELAELSSKEQSHKLTFRLTFTKKRSESLLDIPWEKEIFFLLFQLHHNWFTGSIQRTWQVPENIRLIFQPHPVFGKNSQMVMRNGMGQSSLAPFYLATDDAKSGSQEACAIL